MPAAVRQFHFKRNGLAHTVYSVIEIAEIVFGFLVVDNHFIGMDEIVVACRGEGQNNFISLNRCRTGCIGYNGSGINGFPALKRIFAVILIRQ